MNEDDWQPIKTAPYGEKRGILVCILEEGDYEAIEWVSRWTDPDHEWLNLNSFNYFTSSYGKQFTHWRPLMKLPDDD